MRNMTSTIIFVILSCILLSSTPIFVLGKVHVRVMNRLGNGKVLQIHCQSRDDDLGCVTVRDGMEIEWKFHVNFLGTTLFYCDVQWNSLIWHHFDAYSYERDHRRCDTECDWMISEDGRLFRFNQEAGVWDAMQFKDSWEEEIKEACDGLSG